MTSTVLKGNIVPGATFQYTNDTGGNVRFITQYFQSGVGSSMNQVGTFGFGSGSTAGTDWVQWDLVDGYTTGKNISQVPQSGNPHPNEIMLADGDRVTWVVQNNTYTRNPSYNFVVIPE